VKLLNFVKLNNLLQKINAKKFLLQLLQKQYVFMKKMEKEMKLKKNV